MCTTRTRLHSLTFRVKKVIISKFGKHDLEDSRRILVYNMDVEAIKCRDNLVCDFKKLVPEFRDFFADLEVGKRHVMMHEMTGLELTV